LARITERNKGINTIKADMPRRISENLSYEETNMDNIKVYEISNEQAYELPKLAS
jgi:hypothetical protein